MLGQVMSAARGATDALSGVGRHVNGSLKKIGAKNIEAGIGCGIGFGHGFGVGLGVKPSVLHQVQSSVVQAMTKMMMKFGVAPDMFFGQGSFPSSLQSGISMTSGQSNQNPVGSIMNLATKAPDHTFQGQPRDGNLNAGTTYETFASKDTSLDTSYGSRTEKVINNFLQNPLLNEGKVETNELAGRLRSENNMLQMIFDNFGGSFLPNLSGHNISEAAAAGCAVLTGYHVGHFSHMIAAMKQSNPLSVLQVSGKLELEDALRKLFNDNEVLEAHRTAAKQAYCALSSGIVSNIWNLLESQVLRQVFC